jgi:NitT/TauT family transport system permease protein
MSASASPQLSPQLTARDRFLTEERAERLRAASARIGLILLLIALFLGGWEFLKWVTDSPRTTLPHFHEVINYLFTINSQGDKVWLDTGRNLRLTFIEALTGLAVAIVAGFATGALMALSRWTGRGIMPFVIGAQTVPIVAIAPALVIWLGTGWETKALIAGFLAYFPIAVTTARGIGDVSQDSLDLMASYGASRTEVFFKLRLPSALPFIFTGLEVAAAFSVIGAIVAELPVGSQDGIGVVILTSQQYFSLQPESLFAAIGGACLLGGAMVGMVRIIQVVVLRGYRAQELS